MDMLSEGVAVMSLLQQGIYEPHNIINKSTLFQAVCRKQTNKQQQLTKKQTKNPKATTKSSLAQNGRSPFTVLLKIIHCGIHSYIFRETLHSMGENCFPIMYHGKILGKKNGLFEQLILFNQGNALSL